MKGFLVLLVLVAISAGVFALGKIRRESDDKPLLHVATEVALQVHVAMPTRGRIIRLAQAPGDVEAVLDVDVSSEIVAKIVEMPVEEGDTVHAGDLLCRLDDKFILAEIESAEARIASLSSGIVLAEADLEKADRDCARQVRLSESEATSTLELLDYQTVRKKARAVADGRRHDLEAAEASLRRLHEDLKRTVITSPIDGIISKRNAKPGEVVIMTVTDLSKMRVRVRVDEVEIPLVKAGQKALVYLQSDSDRPVAARVQRVASKGTKQPGRDIVIFEAILDVLEVDDRIKPGMTANVEIEVAEQADAVTIPVEAVVHRMRKELDDSLVAGFDAMQAKLNLSDRMRQAQYIKVVYVKDGELARVRVIEPGIADSKRVEIRNGVAMGEEVIIGPYRSLDQLKDGKKVALVTDEEKKEGADLKKSESADETTTAGAESKESESQERDDSDTTGQDEPDSKKKQAVASSTSP